MATNSSMSKFAPKASGIRDPKDANKRNGLFWNPVRYLYLGGEPQKFNQAGNKKLSCCDPANGQNASGPISDRGKGRG
jgi:hypothetical protein